MNATSHYMENNDSSFSSIVHTPCHVPHDAGAVIICLNTLSIVLGVVGNILVCVVFFKNTRIRVVTYYFLLNLALADLIVNMWAQPIFIKRVYETTMDICKSESTKYYKLTASISCAASIQTLAFVSIDRLISLRYPLKYDSVMTKPRATAMIVFVWINSAAYVGFGIAMDFKENTGWQIYTVMLFVVSYAIIIVSHCLTYRVTKGFILRVYARNQTLNAQVLQNVHDREKKAAKTVATVVNLFTLSWLPYIITTILKGATKDLGIPRFASYLVFTLALMNSSVNPILYCIRNKEFLKALKKLLPFIWHANRVVPTNDMQLVQYRRPLRNQLTNLKQSKCISSTSSLSP